MAEGKVAAAVVVGQPAAVTAEVTAVVKAARERKGAMMAAALMAARKRRWPSQLGTLRSPRTLTPTGTAHRHQQHEAAVEMAPPRSMARSRYSRCKVRIKRTRFQVRHRRKIHLRSCHRYLRAYRCRMRERCPPGTQNTRCGSWCWCMWRRICRRANIRSQHPLNNTSRSVDWCCSFQTRRTHMQATRCRTQRSSQRSEHPC